MKVRFKEVYERARVQHSWQQLQVACSELGVTLSWKSWQRKLEDPKEMRGSEFYFLCLLLGVEAPEFTSPLQKAVFMCNKVSDYIE